MPGRSGGVFAHQSKIERDLSTISGLPEYLRRQGYAAGSRVISAAIRSADSTAAIGLGIEQGDPIYDLLRVRLANGEPVSLEHAVMPANDMPGLLEQPLGGSLTELIREHYGIQPVRALERIEVTLASREEADMLNTKVGAPLLEIVRTTWGESGRAFEFSVDLFRGDRTRIITETTGAGRDVAHSVDGDAVEVHSI